MTNLVDTQLELEDLMVDMSIEKMEEALEAETFHSPQVQMLMQDTLKELTLIYRDDKYLKDLKYPKQAAFATLCIVIPSVFQGTDLRCNALALAGEFFPEESLKRQLQLGTRLLTQIPGFTTGYNEKNHIVVEGTEETKESLVDESQRIAELFPKLKPMIIKPKQWEKGESEGGYLSIRRPLISKRHKTCRNPSTKVLAALNKMQNTPFKCQEKVLEVAKALGVTEEAGPKKKGEKVREYKARVKSLDSVNSDNQKILAIADEYRGYEDFWFTIYTDYRNRGYYAQHYFNGQGSDLARGLLQFSQGKQLGSAKAERWFLINIANLAGKDKLLLKERVKWVKRNHDKILNWAKNPVEDQGWRSGAIAKDGKPWQFLQSCFEYAEYVEKGDDFVNYQPIALDAVCSGIQFWSGLLLDEDGARSVAMMPGDVISDIYSDVMRIGVSLMESDDNPLAKEWLKSNLLNRKMYKTPTMTICYSAGRNAFMKYVRDFCKQHLFKEREKAIKYMVDNLLEAIDGVVKVQRGMDFLKESVKGKGGVDYLSHLGFHIVHKPQVVYKDKVECKVNGQRFQMVLGRKGDAIDERAIQTAIAPNFIHNLDATLMYMVINACPNINSWLMCHDSYATHAADIPEMATACRRCFVELLSQPLFEKFREAMEATDVDLPIKGNYNLKNVLKAPYFFN